MEHPKELLLMEFKPQLLLGDTTYRRKIRHRGKLYKRHTPLALPLMLNKHLPLKLALMATRQDNKTLHRRHHQQMPHIKQLTALIKLITALPNTTTEKRMKRRRPIIHNRRRRMCKPDKVLITLRTPLGQLKQLIQRLGQVFIRLL